MGAALALAPLPPGPYWEALLASVASKDDLVRAHAEVGLEAMAPVLARLVVAFARRRGGDADERLARVERIAQLHRVLLVDPVVSHVETHRPARMAAKLVDPRWRSYGPVRSHDVAAWREAQRLAREAAAVAPVDALVVDAPLVQGGRVPGLERVARMTPAELNLLLRRFGMGRDRGAMLAERLAEQTHRLLGRATRPSAALQERALAAAESAVKQELLAEAKEAVREYEQEKQGWTGDTVLVSKAVGDANTCEDCDALDGEERPMRDWGQDAPGGENRVCKQQCRCEFEEA